MLGEGHEGSKGSEGNHSTAPRAKRLMKVGCYKGLHLGETSTENGEKMAMRHGHAESYIIHIVPV